MAVEQIQRRESPKAAGLRALLGSLATYKMLRWSTPNSQEMTDRIQAHISESDVVSSRRNSDGKHVVVLDIDHPTWLVESTTPGHFHLYINVPDGIKWPAYKNLIHALADAGVIDRGYMQASLQRGATMVPLPWVKKGQER